MKLHIKFWFASLLVLISTATSAYDFEVDGIYYNILSQSNLEVGVTYQKLGNYKNSYRDPLYSETPKYKGEIYIPETVHYNNRTYTVTSILPYAFAGRPVIQAPEGATVNTINIPKTVTEIKECAFNCSELNTIKGGEGIKNIYNRAFCLSYGLRDFPFSDTNINIGDSAFYNCQSLSKIYISNNIKSIGDYSFYNCNRSSSISLGQGIETIGKHAFETCYGFSSIILPSSLKTIKEYAFARCNTLELIDFSNSKVEIENFGFYSCNKLKVINFNTADISFNTGVFQNCQSLETVIIGNNISSIGKQTFMGCESLSKVVIGENINLIDSYAFNDCTSLSEVYFTSSKRPQIANNAFLNCHRTMEQYVPNYNIYGFGIEYITFEENEFPYAGKPHKITYSNNIKFLNCEAQGDLETEINSGTHSQFLKFKYSGEIDLLLNIPYQYTINKIPLTIKINNIEREYGVPNPDFSCICEGFINDENINNIGSNFTYFCEATEKSDVGIYEISADFDPINYNVNIKKGILKINKAKQQIIWDQDINNLKQYDFINLYATSSSDLLVDFAIDAENKGKALLSYDKNWQIQFLEPGEITITAFQDGNNNYFAADSISRKFVIAMNPNPYLQDELGLRYLIISPNTVKVIANEDNPYEGNIEIPSYFSSKEKEYKVVEIDDNAFNGCNELTQIVIPNSIIKIDDNAFKGCTKLEYIKICDGSILDNNLDNLFPDSPIKELFIGSDALTYNSDSRILGIVKIMSLGSSVSTFPPAKAFNSLKCFIVEDGDSPIIEPEDYCTRSSSLISRQEIRDSYTYIYYRFFYLITYNHLSPILTALQNNVLDYIHIGREIKGVEVDTSKTQEKIPTTAGSRYQEYGYYDEVNYQYQEIIAKSDYNRNPIESIEFVKDIVPLKIGESILLNLIVNPENASYTVFDWKSNDENIAIVDNFGNVTKLSEGETFITATTKDGSNLIAICRIIDSVDAEQIVLNLESTELNIGETIQLEVTVLPEGTTDKIVTWNSSNENIAVVTDKGLVTAISDGEAIIIAACGNITATCLVTVVNPVIVAEQIVLNVEETELNIGETIQLEAIVLPENTTDKTVTWNSSNESVASVSEDGLVSAISEGSAIITVTCGSVSAECAIKVLDEAGIESLLANPHSKISIYTTDGILIKKDCKIEDLRKLTKGLYIIKSGIKSYKIAL